MAAPVPVLRVDWANDGTFTGPIDTVHPVDDPGLSFTRGRSGDFTADVTGQMTFALDNTDDAYSPDRNWHDNPSFEVDTTGWSTAAVAGFTSAASSIAAVVDNAPSAGVAAGEVVLPAVSGAGVTYSIPYHFRAGVNYSVAVYLKSMSGTTSIQAGIGATAKDPSDELARGMPEGGGYPVDQATGAGTISGAWARYTFTWTPIGDRTLSYFFVRSTAASAATFRIDAVQINPGSSANVYLEAPTKGQLVPGRPVHLYATHSGLNWPLFYGFIERISPELQGRKVMVTVYDVFRRYSETDVIVAANTFATRTARDLRIEALSDYERGNRNLINNPSFETDVSGWNFFGSGTRIANDAAPVGGSTACAEVTTGVGGTRIATFTSHMAPVFFAGQTYRFAIWLRAPGGNVSVVLNIGSPGALVSKTVTVTSTWARYTVTATLATNIDGNTGLAVELNRVSSVSLTLRLDAVSFTRGQSLYTYSDTGTGRWPNWCGQGSFDAGGLTGWQNAWTNLCTNGSFEVDVSGWSIAGDAFVAAAATLVRSLAQGGAFGVASANPAGAGTAGMFYAFGARVFKAGRTYSVSLWRNTGGGSGTTGIHGIGSNGTPTDVTKLTSQSFGAGWQQFTFSWVPTADRSDVHLFVGFNATGVIGFVDGVEVVEQVSPSPLYSDTGPGGGGSMATTDGAGTIARWGSGSLFMDTPATATAGHVYDFNHWAAFFTSGQAYTASVWLRSSSLGTTPVKIGLSANKGDGTWDEATATANINNLGWTQVSVTWTPTADRSSATPLNVVLFIYQTDAVARRIYIDGVRVIPGSSVDNFEQPYWDIPAAAEPEAYTASASLGGSTLAALQTLNGLTLSRHWIVADMATPYYRYRVQDRATFASAGSAEAYTDVQALTPPELDRQAITNTDGAQSTAGIDYISDETSVATYGPRPGTTVTGQGFTTAPNVATVATALLARYSQPIKRPTFTIENRWPSQLQRDVNDMTWVTIDPWLIRSMFGSIARLTTDIDQAGQHWTTRYQVEESPNADGAYGSLALALPE